ALSPSFARDQQAALLLLAFPIARGLSGSCTAWHSSNGGQDWVISVSPVSEAVSSAGCQGLTFTTLGGIPTLLQAPAPSTNSSCMASTDLASSWVPWGNPHGFSTLVAPGVLAPGGTLL